MHQTQQCTTSLLPEPLVNVHIAVSTLTSRMYCTYCQAAIFTQDHCPVSSHTHTHTQRCVSVSNGVDHDQMLLYPPPPTLVQVPVVPPCTCPPPLRHHHNYQCHDACCMSDVTCSRHVMLC